MRFASVLLVLASLAAAVPTLDVTNTGQIQAAMKAAMPFLAQYFNQSVGGVPNSNTVGAWLEAYDDNRHNVQWHESGIYWGLFYEYTGLTGDTSYATFVDTNVQLALSSYNGQTAFLDAISAASGRWNDDIGWWGISMMSAAEAMPNGVVASFNLQQDDNPAYISVANATWSQMYENWDASTCNGGIFWARNRNAPNKDQAYYKSSITNAQHIELSARLLAATGDKSGIYQAQFDQVYNWMKSAVINPATYEVSDGVNTQNNACSNSQLQFSYHSGELLAALSRMYKYTKQQTYLDEAHKHFAHIVSMFTQNNVVYDPQCAGAGATGCKNPTGYNWAVYKGMADLSAVTDQPSVKAQILTIFQASANAVISTTCQDSWNCIRQLPESTDFTLWDGTNIRDQFEIVALLTSVARAAGIGVQQVAQITQQIPVATQGPAAGNQNPKMVNGQNSGSGNSNTLLYAAIGGGVGALLIIVGAIAFCYSRAKKRAAERAQQQQRNLSQKIYQDAQRSGSRNGPGAYPQYPPQGGYSPEADYSQRPQRGGSRGAEYGSGSRGYAQQQGTFSEYPVRDQRNGGESGRGYNDDNRRRR